MVAIHCDYCPKLYCTDEHTWTQYGQLCCRRVGYNLKSYARRWMRTLTSHWNCNEFWIGVTCGLSTVLTMFIIKETITKSSNPNNWVQGGTYQVGITALPRIR